MKTTLHAIPVLKDNIIWAMAHGNEAIVIDPSISKPVKNWLKQNQLDLKAVLQTHHHSDHIGGTPDLIKYFPRIEVIASVNDKLRIPFQTNPVKDGDQLEIFDHIVTVLDVAAHTSSHIAFHFNRNYKSTDSGLSPILFCGDTLFSGGCGRIFEGTAADMYKALQKFKKLSDETLVCCAHEYTENNLLWALEICPDDIDIRNRLNYVIHKRSQSNLSLPSTIGIERLTNLFLRATSSEELSILRKLKDNWL